MKRFFPLRFGFLHLPRFHLPRCPRCPHLHPHFNPHLPPTLSTYAVLVISLLERAFFSFLQFKPFSLVLATAIADMAAEEKLDAIAGVVTNEEYLL